MFKFTEVPEGLLLTLTDEARLREEFPKLDVNLYEAMEYCDFAPEGTKADEWDDISGSTGHAAIGNHIYDDGELCFDINVPFRMFENQAVGKDDILEELVKRKQLLFTPFRFKNMRGEEIL